MLKIPSEEEYKIQFFKNSNTYLENFKVGFYGLCSYQKDSWNKVLESVREYYNDEPICIINDGTKFDYSDLSEKYNTTLLKEDVEICTYWTDILYMHLFLERTKKVCEMFKDVDWIIYLHPDSFCNDKIKYHPNAHIAGVDCGSGTYKSKNMFCKEDVDYIHQFHPNLEINGWGFVGGSIFHRNTFLKVFENIQNISNLKIPKYIYQCDDSSLPYLFNLSGYIYRAWRDISETHRGLKNTAFIHGDKQYYLVKETRNSFNKRIMDEIEIEQFKNKVVNTLKHYSKQELTDKASDHSYEHVYPNILSEFYNKKVNILEIGVSVGGSILCWSDLFPTSSIYGVDKNLSNVVDEVLKRKNVQLFEGSQSELKTFEFTKNIKFDLIIDDASHRKEDQIITFNMLRNRLNKGGYYVIEDIYPEYVYPNDFLKNFDIRNLTSIKNRSDDKVFIYKFK